MIAGAFALRAEALPQMQLWDLLLNRPIYLDFHEDNEAMIKISKSAHTAKMRHLARTHRVNCAFVAERFQDDPYINLLSVKTDDQAADMYTMRFPDPRKWHQQLEVLHDHELVWPTQALSD